LQRSKKKEGERFKEEGGRGLWGGGNVNKKNTTIKSNGKKTNKAKRSFLEPTKHNQKSNAIRDNHLHNIAYQHYLIY
jgi:hypothetical protein